MRERARVTRVDGELVMLVVETACGKSCANCTKTAKSRSFEARNTKKLELASGDCVEVYAAQSGTIFSACRVFLLPLAFFACAYALAVVAFGAGDTAGFFAGLVGVSVAFLFNYFAFGKSRNTRLPCVIEKLNPKLENRYFEE